MTKVYRAQKGRGRGGGAVRMKETRKWDEGPSG
jgi:hypothetical protein